MLEECKCILEGAKVIASAVETGLIGLGTSVVLAAIMHAACTT